MATLIGRFLPIYYPGLHFVDECCYVLSGKNVDILGEVSPDGSIRRFDCSGEDSPKLGNVIAAVEIKCPFPTERSLPVHYSLPEYYVAQCLAEMVVLQTDILIFVSYSNESTAQRFTKSPSAKHSGMPSGMRLLNYMTLKTQPNLLEVDHSQRRSRNTYHPLPKRTLNFCARYHPSA